MAPSNGHELAISKIVDKLDVEGSLSTRAIEDVIRVLDFAMSKVDEEFLVSYILWRMDNPMWKANLRGMGRPQ